MEEHLLKRLELLENRLHDHIEHYAQNNKQLALLAQRMDTFVNMFDKHQINEEGYQERVESQLQKLEVVVDKLDKLDIEAAKDVITNYRGLLSVKGLILGLAAVVVSIGALGAFLSSLVRHLTEGV